MPYGARPNERRAGLRIVVKRRMLSNITQGIAGLPMRQRAGQSIASMPNKLCFQAKSQAGLWSDSIGALARGWYGDVDNLATAIVV